MYNINDYVEYIHPLSLNQRGLIKAKLKIIDSVNGDNNKILYSICYNDKCCNDLILEENIIFKLTKGGK